jgi:hypothetical protein
MEDHHGFRHRLILIEHLPLHRIAPRTDLAAAAHDEEEDGKKD